MDTYAVVGWPGGAPCSHPYHTDASYTRCYALTRHLYTPPPPPYMAVLATAATAPAAAAGHQYRAPASAAAAAFAAGGHYPNAAKPFIPYRPTS